MKKGLDHVFLKPFVRANFVENIFLKHSIGKGISRAVSAGEGMAVYRLPGENSAHFVAGNCTEIRMVDENLHAFMVQPFLPSSPAIAIQANTFSSFVADHLTSEEKIHWHRGREKKFTNPDYEQLVRQALQQIDAGELKKAVPARTLKKSLQTPLDPLAFFALLCQNYPQAYVSLVSLPQYGTWIGASPELLLRVSDRVETVALAGTKKAGAAVNFSAKEYAEQKLVSDYIEKKFTKLNWPVEVSEPKETSAGALRHLQTFFSAPYKDNWPQLLKLLHPTPAVCGAPAEKALAFLKENEGFDRELYGGFLGPCNLGEQTVFFVNLRCMQFLGTEVMFYAGAGVVSGSDPHLELQETREKMNTLGGLIEN